jgi:L-iditol 2-dehydrogenase
VAVPAIAPGELLVEVRACGVCATDVKTYQRGHPHIAPGSVLGHEIAGVVVRTDETADWRPGDRVVVAPYAPCGTCRPCQRGHFAVCQRLFEQGPDPGGFADYVRVPHRLVERGLVRIPNGVSFAAASFSEPLGCCLHSLEEVGLGAGDSLLVIGDGPMGLLHAELGRHLGAEPVLLSGATTERLELASTIVDAAIDVRREGLASAVRRRLPGGADRVVVTVGQPALVEEALALAAPGGAVTLFAGLPQGPATAIDLGRVHYEEVRLLGTFGFTPRNLARAVELIASGTIAVERFITATVGLAEAREALEAAASYQGIKTMVLRREEGSRQ